MALIDFNCLKRGSTVFEGTCPSFPYRVIFSRDFISYESFYDNVSEQSHTELYEDKTIDTLDI